MCRFLLTCRFEFSQKLSQCPSKNNRTCTVIIEWSYSIYVGITGARKDDKNGPFRRVPLPTVVGGEIEKDWWVLYFSCSGKILDHWHDHTNLPSYGTPVPLYAKGEEQSSLQKWEFCLSRFLRFDDTSMTANNNKRPTQHRFEGKSVSLLSGTFVLMIVFPCCLKAFGVSFYFDSFPGFRGAYVVGDEIFFQHLQRKRWCSFWRPPQQNSRERWRRQLQRQMISGLDHPALVTVPIEIEQRTIRDMVKVIPLHFKNHAGTAGK